MVSQKSQQQKQKPSPAFGSPWKTARKVMEIGCLTNICSVLLYMSAIWCPQSHHGFPSFFPLLYPYPIFRAPGTIVPRLLLTWRNCQLQTAANLERSGTPNQLDRWIAENDDITNKDVNKNMFDWRAHLGIFLPNISKTWKTREDTSNMTLFNTKHSGQIRPFTCVMLTHTHRPCLHRVVPDVVQLGLRFGRQSKPQQKGQTLDPHHFKWASHF